jgi:CheY-like chemotaxis protein
MKMLLVEDNPSVIDLLSEALQDIAAIAVTVAKSRDSALEHLRGHTFDVIVLDLKLPTKDDQLDEEVDHGVFVCTEAQKLARNTPIFVFTAFGTSEVYSKKLMPLATKEDVFGDGAVSVMSAIKKEDLPDLIAEIKTISEKLRSISQVELVGDEERGEVENRLIRVLARRRNASVVELKQLSGGLSGSSVWKFELRDQHGATSQLGVAKLGIMDELLSEKKGYTENIQSLQLGGYAPILDHAQGCTGANGAVFFRLADHCPHDLIEVIRTDPARASSVVQKLRQIQEPWLHNRPTTMLKASDIRRTLVSDDQLSVIVKEYQFISDQLFDARVLSARMCPQHGDLHGANVLVTSKFDPVLIDYGRVGIAPASLDPLTLELSIFFHPSSEVLDKSWLSIEAIRYWRDVDRYAEGCPYIDVLKALRNWQNEVRAGERETFATLFSYCLRQFRFQQTNKEIAGAFTAMASGEIAKSFAS